MLVKQSVHVKVSLNKILNLWHLKCSCLSIKHFPMGINKVYTVLKIKHSRVAVSFKRQILVTYCSVTTTCVLINILIILICVHYSD